MAAPAHPARFASTGNRAIWRGLGIGLSPLAWVLAIQALGMGIIVAAWAIAPASLMRSLDNSHSTQSGVFGLFAGAESLMYLPVLIAYGVATVLTLRRIAAWERQGMIPAARAAELGVVITVIALAAMTALVLFGPHPTMPPPPMLSQPA